MLCDRCGHHEKQDNEVKICPSGEMLNMINRFLSIFPCYNNISTKLRCKMLYLLNYIYFNEDEWEDFELSE